jgi:hypothetical protein
MNVTGVSYIQQLLQSLTNSSSSSSSSSSDSLLQNVLLNSASNSSSLYTLPSSESFHMDIELTDGTKVSIDYTWQGVSSKTSYELGQYGNYTYGTDYYTPENTANRILDFAKDLWDGSTDTLETLANAMDEGVKQARKALGNIPSWLDRMITRTSDLLKKGVEEMKAQDAQAA